MTNIKKKLIAAERIANREPEDECEHKYTKLGGTKDGTYFFRCRKCGKETTN